MYLLLSVETLRVEPCNKGPRPSKSVTGKAHKNNQEVGNNAEREKIQGFYMET